jgi:hypothetical protein
MGVLLTRYLGLKIKLFQQRLDQAKQYVCKEQLVKSFRRKKKNLLVGNRRLQISQNYGVGHKFISSRWAKNCRDRDLIKIRKVGVKRIKLKSLSTKL